MAEPFEVVGNTAKRTRRALYQSIGEVGFSKAGNA
jgi:hypothetical protein